MQAADTLRGLGLFRGTNAGDELERIPTRQEAVTMLVRLLGKETEAKAGEWTTPFTDVPDWAKPYVGYAYANGLVTGTGATTFGAEQMVDANQYATMVLRALGYSSGKDKDFTWDGAAEFAVSVGLPSAPEGDFLRGDVAEQSLAALSCQTKGGTDTLLDMLVKTGAVSEALAQAAGLLEQELIWRDGVLFVPRDATLGYLRQLYPNAVALVWAQEQTEEAFRKNSHNDPFPWDALPVEERCCSALWESSFDFPQQCPDQPSNTFLFGWFEGLLNKDYRQYGFLIDSDYQILAYCDNRVSEDGILLDKTWPPQNTNCREAVNKSMETMGSVSFTVDRENHYGGWDDGTGICYHWAVSARESVDYSKVHYAAWSSTDPANPHITWSDDEVRSLVHFTIHRDFTIRYVGEDGEIFSEESQHFGSYSALEYVEEAGAWCVWSKPDKPIYYLFYAENGEMLGEFYTP